MSGYKILPSAGGGGGPAGPAGFTDAFALNIKIADSNALPTDAAAFAMTLLKGDTNVVPSELVKLGFPAPDFAETSPVPTDANSFFLKVWLTGSAGAGVTSPANANGSNDAAVATISTAVAGATTETMTSALGSGVPTVAITSVVFRGYFKSVNVLVTSTGLVVMSSIGTLFTDKTMFSNAALNTTVDHLTGTFTYDLLANGIDTLAKIQSCQLVCSTTDAAAGVQPHILTVDAGVLEIAGAFV